jgi:thiamine kinase
VIISATTDKSLQPENAINSWSQWGAGLGSRPVLSGELSGGRSNQSYLLDSDIGKLVLRINGTGSLLPGSSRNNEIKIWQAASKQGTAPPLLYVDTQNQYLVSVYIHNELPPQPQHNTACVDQAFKLLEACHQLDVNAPTINYLSHIEHYWQIIETRDQPPDPALISQRKPMHSTLELLLKSNTSTGLCHHDPVIANFVGAPNRLYLIDWEYAANGLQIMDYAALATEWKIDDANILTRTSFDPKPLTMAKALYEYLCSLWEAATT